MSLINMKLPVIICYAFFSSIYQEAFAAIKRDNSISTITRQQQKLSPYELAMISDLLIQISLYRCQSVNRPGVKSLKSYIFTTFGQAPEAGVAHPDFYTNYRSLVLCLSYLDDNFPKKPISTPSEVVPANEKEKRKRRNVDSFEDQNELIPYDKKNHQTTNQNKQPFELLFTDLYGIVKNSCPPQIAPNPSFLTSSLQEIVQWINQHSMVMLAKEKYFDNMGILEQVHKCSEIATS